MYVVKKSAATDTGHPYFSKVSQNIASRSTIRGSVFQPSAQDWVDFTLSLKSWNVADINNCGIFIKEKSFDHSIHGQNCALLNYRKC
jgi:hypothetical protein